MKKIIKENTEMLMEKEKVINKQELEIQRLKKMLQETVNNNSQPADSIDDTKINVDESYCMVNVKGNDLEDNTNLKKGIINDDYLSDSYKLSTDESKYLEDNKLEDIGGKNAQPMHLELNSKEDDINHMNYKYHVLLAAYEQEKNKNNPLSMLKRLFGS